MAQWATDTQFRCGTVAQLIWHPRAGNTAYQFQFSRVPPGRESVGAAHGSELPYVFGTLSIASRTSTATLTSFPAPLKSLGRAKNVNRIDSLRPFRE